MSPEKPRRLGRGLEALLGNASSARPVVASSSASPENELRRIELSRVRPNPFQPRRDFAEAELADLRASLAASGMLQPVVVRSVGNSFELISGERRFRAALQLGWHEIPALIREADERTMLTLALIENLQRADLSAIEEARGYQRLHDEFQLTHQQISEAVGKDRSTVTNLLRLLALPTSVQELLERGKLSMGHARALLAIADPRTAHALALRVVAGELSVRQTEERIRELATPGETSKRAPLKRSSDAPRPSTDPAIRQIEDSLRRRFQTDVHVQMQTPGKGTIQLAFYSTEDLNRLLALLSKRPEIGD